MKNNSPQACAGIIRCLVTSVAIAAATAAPLGTSYGQQSSESVEFNIPAGGLVEALDRFAEQSGFQIISDQPLLSGRQAAALSGRYTLDDALKLLLRGTNIDYAFVDGSTVVLRRTRPATNPAAKVSPRANALDAKEGDKARVEEIIVTAQKREESVRDIPISIAVIGNQEIERRGLIGMEDYLRSIPGVNQLDRGFDNAIVIRGITTSPQSENFSSGTTVASYFDETPITGAGGQGGGGIDVRPVDIERIEVLRGPQGTAYGSASLGGTMRVIPVEPRLDGFKAKVAASYSNTSGSGSDNSMLQGALNVPIVTDVLALRAVGYQYDESGFYRNIGGVDARTISFAQNFGLGDFVDGSVQEDIGRMRSSGGRVAALWQPAENLNLSAKWLSQKTEQDGRPEAGVPGGGGAFQQARIPATPQGRVRGQVGEVADTDLDLLNVKLNYDFGWAALTSTASWVNGGSLFIQTFGPQNSPAFGASSSTGRSDFDSFSAETRVASRFDSRLQFLAGVFYEEVQDSLLQTFDWPGALATNPFGTNPLFVFDSSREVDQRAAFGEISFSLTEKLIATVGGRYFDYEKEERVLREGGFLRVPLGTGVWQNLQASEDGSTYKANVNYKPSDDSLLYVSWSEGFRLGRPDAGLSSVCDSDADGFVDGTSLPIESTRRVDSDFLENYEIGGKVALFDRRMVVDAAIYHIKWDGLPIRSIAPTCGLAFIANAGAATSDGVEFQASVFLTDGLRLDLGAGYGEAELSEDAPGLGASEGARLPGSPRLSANLAAQYEFNVGSYAAFIRADSFYAGKFYGDLLKTPETMAGDYVKLDARAGLEFQTFSVEIFVRNVTNEDAYTWRGISVREPNFGFRVRPRTIGLQLGYRFE